MTIRSQEPLSLGTILRTSPQIASTLESLLSLIFSRAYLCAIGLSSTATMLFGFAFFAITQGYGAQPENKTRMFSPGLTCWAILKRSVDILGEKYTFSTCSLS